MDATFAVYHSSGVRVSFTEATISFDSINDLITEALQNGFTVNLPGLVAGEKRENVGAIVRYNKKNSNNTTSPRIYFYSDKEILIHKLVDTYLDTDDQVREFEAFSGLDLRTVPAWAAKATPDRKEAAEADVLIAVKKPFTIVFKDNPDYKGAGDLEHTARLFVRYEPIAPPAGSLPPTQTVKPSGSDSTGNTSGNGGASGDKFAKDFPATTSNVWTPETLYPRVSKLFDARAHFDASINKHVLDLEGKTLEEATAFYQDLHWNYDAVRAADFSAFAKNTFEMSSAEVLTALTNANERKVSKWRDWSGGNWNTAMAALWAYQAAYDLDRLREYTRKENVSDALFIEAARISKQYRDQHPLQEAS